MPNPTICYDHLGNKFSSETKMCEAHNVNYFTYITRKRKGWPLEKCLSENTNFCYDHLGNKFNSRAKMAKFYNIGVKQLENRLNRGWPLKCALLKPIKSSTNHCYDHLGNKYNSEIDMADAYNIPERTYRSRKKRGWPLERILTTPPNSKEDKLQILLKTHEKECYDHLGNKFDSITKMCEHYGLTSAQYSNRKNLGWTLKQILETPVRTSKLLDIPVNSTIITNQGFKVTCIESDKSQIKVIFEDGATKSIRKTNFKRGSVSHPLIKPQGKNIYCGNIRGMKMFTFEDRVYYNCQCSKCNWKHKKLLTAQQFLQHGKECT